MGFSTYNVQFEILSDEDYTLIKGEITNETPRNYTVALFKIFVYSNEVAVCNGTIRVNDLRAGATRHFEAVLDLHRSRISKISGFEILFEHGY